MELTQSLGEEDLQQQSEHIGTKDYPYNGQQSGTDTGHACGSIDSSKYPLVEDIPVNSKIKMQYKLLNIYMYTTAYKQAILYCCITSGIRITRSTCLEFFNCVFRRKLPTTDIDLGG